MKLKKNILFLIIFAVFIIYFFSAIRPLKTEYQFSPEWTISISDKIEKNTTQKAIPFKLGQTIGYFTPDGKITNFLTFPFKATISENYYAMYGPDANNISFYNPEGEKQGVISNAGFPFIIKDKLFIFLPGGNSFIQCNKDGSEKWKYEGTMPITTFSVSNSSCVAGFVNGEIKVFNEKGITTQQYKPGGSKYDVIFGCDISPDGKYTACVSGLEKQRFVVTEKFQAQNKIILFDYLNKDLTEQTLVQFSTNGRYVCYNYNGGIGIADIKKRNIHHIPLNGKVLSLKEDTTSQRVYILSKKDGIYTVSLLESFKNIAGSFSFKADNAFIRTAKNAIFVGKDTTISKMIITKK